MTPTPSDSEMVKDSPASELAQMAARSFARESILIAFHAAENSTGAEPSISVASRALSDALAAVDAAIEAALVCRPDPEAVMRLADAYAEKYSEWHRGDAPWNEKCAARAALLAAVTASDPPACRGTNCATTTGNHSAECIAEHAAAVRGTR